MTTPGSGPPDIWQSEFRRYVAFGRVSVATDTTRGTIRVHEGGHSAVRLPSGRIHSANPNRAASHPKLHKKFFRTLKFLCEPLTSRGRMVYTTQVVRQAACPHVWRPNR